MVIGPCATTQKLPTVLELCVERTSKSADRAIATSQPRFPFSVEVGVGPESALVVVGTLYLLVFAFAISKASLANLFECLLLDRITRHRCYI